MSEVSQKVLMAIPSINGEHLLKRLFPTLRAHVDNIVVLDQGSTDGTAAVCREFGIEILQLSTARTYTQASNIAIEMARSRNLKYVCIANNDIAFRCDVLGHLLAEMERDPLLGIVAPAQVIIDEAAGKSTLTYRVSWDLSRIDFLHDIEDPDPSLDRIESDFCELTCAMIRLSAVDRIGGFDDEFGFYHEDADFGLRLRQAGYNCAYLPKVQIDHYSGSTINADKLARRAAYIAKNKVYFARKHLGFGVGPATYPSTFARMDPYEQEVRSVLKRFGLARIDAPPLIFSRGFGRSEGFLHTTHDAKGLPTLPLAKRGPDSAIFTPFSRMHRMLSEAGVPNVFTTPLGVDPDLFYAKEPNRRLFEERTFLAFPDNFGDSTLRRLVEAWQAFRTSGGGGRLLLCGEGFQTDLLGVPNARHDGIEGETTDYVDWGITVSAFAHSMRPEQIAGFLRSVDYVVESLGGAGGRLLALKAQAVGTPTLAVDRFDDGESSSAFKLDGSSDLRGAFDRAASLSSKDHEIMRAQAARTVRDSLTVRHTAVAFFTALASIQEANPDEVVEVVRRRSALGRDFTAPAGRPDMGLSFRHRAGTFTARRLQSLGRLIVRFASTWEQNGIGRAGRSMASELGLFIAYRSRIVRNALNASLNALRSRLSQRASRDPERFAKATLLVGYIDAQLGLGQSLRGLAYAMDATGQAFSIHPWTMGVEDRRGTPYMPERYNEYGTHGVNVFEVATNELPHVLRNFKASRLDGSYNILRTYWELGRAPEVWRPALERIDEIWAPNNFVGDSLRHIFEGPITIVPPCIRLPQIKPTSRATFGLAEGTYQFLFSFDYYSFPQRKNPLAIVASFREAFADSNAPVSLVMKSVGSPEHYPDVKDALRAACEMDDRIQLIDRSLDRGEMLSLLQTTDCYVSLHRAEGFGLGMAEALALEKAVIGTNYSGNTDFLTEETGWPVPFRLRPVGKDEYIHSLGQVWAEPSVRACANIMRRVIEDRGEAARRAAAGKALIASRFGPQGVGTLVADRLAEIHRDRINRQPTSVSGA